MRRREEAKAREARARAERELRLREAREERRAADRAASMRGMAEAEAKRAAAAQGPTFGTFIESSGLAHTINRTTTRVIELAQASNEDHARDQRIAISCHGCTSPKGCCKITVRAFLHEGVPIAARLRADGRDTPEMRASLQASAEAMEGTARDHHTAPCVFLDASERCSIYSDRPSECGAQFTFSDPLLCSSTDPNARIDRIITSIQLQGPAAMEQGFVQDVGLRREGFRYEGVLPRMVLLCLEAWERRDYVEFLASRGRLAAESLASVQSLPGRGT